MPRAELYLASFPFGDAPGMKLRPVLLLTEPVGLIPEVVAAYISSVIPTEPLPSDLLLDPATPDFPSTNLKTPSVMRLHKLATIHTRGVVRYAFCPLILGLAALGYS
jgi:mRNA interferase MazF